MQVTQFHLFIWMADFTHVCMYVCVSIVLYPDTKIIEKMYFGNIKQTFARRALGDTCYGRFLKVERHGPCRGSLLLSKGKRPVNR